MSRFISENTDEEWDSTDARPSRNAEGTTALSCRDVRASCAGVGAGVCAVSPDVTCAFAS